MPVPETSTGAPGGAARRLQEVQAILEQAGIDASRARQLVWIATEIPSDHPLRTLKVPYSLLRAVVGTGKLDAWTHYLQEFRRQNGKFPTLVALKKEIGRTHQSANRILQCERCGRRLPAVGDAILVREGLKPPIRLCSRACAIKHFFRRRVLVVPRTRWRRGLASVTRRYARNGA